MNADQHGVSLLYMFIFNSKKNDAILVIQKVQLSEVSEFRWDDASELVRVEVSGRGNMS